MTRRTNFRKAFLAPWHPLVEQCWLYALADAQREHGFELHHAVRVVSHHHLSLTAPEPNMGEVLRRFHHEVSCALNTLLAHERYDAPRNLFDGRRPHEMRLLDAAAQASHLTYEYLNPVAAGLVARPEHMPGTVLDWGHWKSGGIIVKRPEVFFGVSRPEELRLELSPPALLYQAFDGDLDALVHHMRRLSEDGVAALRAARPDRPVLGAQKLARMHPWNEPKTLAEPGGRIIPTFKIGARGLVGRKARGDAAAEVSTFHKTQELARHERLAGRAAVFPYGTYAMRVFHNAPVADPLPGAIVAQPGVLLCEIRDRAPTEVTAAPLDDNPRPAREPVVSEVRAAWDEEAAEVIGVETLDFAEYVAAAKTDAAATDSAPRRRRPPPRVRHRFDRDPDHSTVLHPARLIIERDRRRGRRVGPPDGAGPPS